MTQASADNLAFNKLQLSAKTKSYQNQRPEPQDSWEDDDGTEDHGEETQFAQKESTTKRSTSSSNCPGPPTHTAAFPSVSSGNISRGSPYQTFPPYGLHGSFEDTDGPQPSFLRRAGEDRRPEKSTAVASRLIAAGVGQKAPRRTEEQRKYDQAVKIQEKKRRDQAKAEEERLRLQIEQAKKAIWED